MERSEQAWRAVGEMMSSVAEKFRRHYQAQETPDATTEEVKRALDTLLEAADRLTTSLGDAIRDPEVREDAKQAGAALADALEITFSELGKALRRSHTESRPSNDGPGRGA